MKQRVWKSGGIRPGGVLVSQGWGGCRYSLRHERVGLWLHRCHHAGMSSKVLISMHGVCLDGLGCSGAADSQVCDLAGRLPDCGANEWM